MNISTKRKKLLKQKEKIEQQLLQLKKECPHVNFSTKHDNNYDFYNSCYWTYHTCNDCGHTWPEQQQKL